MLTPVMPYSHTMPEQSTSAWRMDFVYAICMCMYIYINVRGFAYNSRKATFIGFQLEAGECCSMHYTYTLNPQPSMPNGHVLYGHCPVQTFGTHLGRVAVCGPRRALQGFFAHEKPPPRATTGA